jgi:hypothetical protein
LLEAVAAIHTLAATHGAVLGTGADLATAWDAVQGAMFDHTLQVGGVHSLRVATLHAEAEAVHAVRYRLTSQLAGAGRFIGFALSVTFRGLKYLGSRGLPERDRHAGTEKNQADAKHVHGGGLLCKWRQCSRITAALEVLKMPGFGLWMPFVGELITTRIIGKKAQTSGHR